MTFGQSITTCMGKYATFSGRATRSEYWWFYLFSLLLGWFADVVGALTIPGAAGQYLGMMVGLVLLVPSLSAATRRLHDTGRSGWWQLLIFTIVGIVVLVVWSASEGEKTANAYGEPPALEP